VVTRLFDASFTIADRTHFMGGLGFSMVRPRSRPPDVFGE
jgi:hypothetical protein